MTLDLTTKAETVVGWLKPAAAHAVRHARRFDDGFYADTFAPVPASLIEHQVWGRGDKLNELGLAVREILETRP